MGRPGCERGRQTGVGLVLPRRGATAGMLLAVAATTERSARDLAAAIRAGELSAREVVEAHAWRLHSCQPRTNALACDRFADGAGRGRGRRRADRRRRPRRRAAAVPRRAVHDQGVDRAARDAELRRPRRAARPPLRDDRARGAAADRRGLHPARRDEHVGADDVDRVRQPRLRPHPQRLRPAPHRRRLVRRRGRGGRLGRLAGRPRLGHRRLDPPARVLQRRLRPQAVARPGAEHRASSRATDGRGRVHAHDRPARPPRRGPDAGDADRLGARRAGRALRRARARRPRGRRPRPRCACCSPTTPRWCPRARELREARDARPPRRSQDAGARCERVSLKQLRRALELYLAVLGDGAGVSLNELLEQSGAQPRGRAAVARRACAGAATTRRRS